MTPSDFLTAALAAGCPRDQVENFLRAGITLEPKQILASAAARSCDLPNGPTHIAYGGARGGGKSHWSFAQTGADDCQRYPGLKCLLLRKVAKSNFENLNDFRLRLFSRLPHTFHSSRGRLTFANGSSLLIGHFQKESDIDSHLGLEYDLIIIEEATTLSQRKFLAICTCCRTSKPGWRPRIYSNANPGGVGHHWYRNKFIVPWRAGKETDTRFIPATIDDNPNVNPDYRLSLDSLPGWLGRAWRHGDWDIAAGQFFSTFRHDVHVISDFNDSRVSYWVASLDYGFTHYTAVLLGGYDYDGTLFIVDEHAQRNWLPERHAEAIRAMLKRHRIDPRANPADPRARGLRYTPGSMRNITPEELEALRQPRALSRFVAGRDIFASPIDGTNSIALQYALLGFKLRPAETDRINGWAEILKLLGDPANGGKPRLYIHKRCARLIETLPALQHDPNRPEDVLKTDPDEDGTGGDDTADALRYMVATKTHHIRQINLKGL